MRGIISTISSSTSTYKHTTLNAFYAPTSTVKHFWYIPYQIPLIILHMFTFDRCKSHQKYLRGLFLRTIILNFCKKKKLNSLQVWVFSNLVCLWSRERKRELSQRYPRFLYIYFLTFKIHNWICTSSKANNILIHSDQTVVFSCVLTITYCMPIHASLQLQYMCFSVVSTHPHHPATTSCHLLELLCCLMFCQLPGCKRPPASLCQQYFIPMAFLSP